MTMRRFIFLISFFLSCSAGAQLATGSIKITGNKKSEQVILPDTLLKIKTTVLSNLPITNHRGELKYTIKQAKGASVKDLFSSIEFDVKQPKDLSSYLMVCKAADGYEVVFSWNELFNTPVGEKVYVLYQIDDNKIDEDKGGAFSLYSAADYRSGRRFVKWLSEIKISKIDNQ